MAISAAQVKELREISGAGMMDCKKALAETDGDQEKAIDYLRTKGLQAVEKKSGRATSEGAIQTYIHPGSRLGVMVEIACETDFVARTPDFQEFTKNVAMHIAASKPVAVDKEGVSQDLVDREMDIYRAQMKEQGKPDNIIDKIVQGKIDKYYQEVCLLEQNYVKDTDKTVRDVLNETISKLGENMLIKRFVRFELGE
jgi:elongation factor Ts